SSATKSAASEPLSVPSVIAPPDRPQSRRSYRALLGVGHGPRRASAVHRRSDRTGGSINRWPMKRSFASCPFIARALGSVVLRHVSFDRLCPLKSAGASRPPPAPPRSCDSFGLRLRLEALHRGPRFDQRTIVVP